MSQKFLLFFSLSIYIYTFLFILAKFKKKVLSEKQIFRLSICKHLLSPVGTRRSTPLYHTLT